MSVCIYMWHNWQYVCFQQLVHKRTQVLIPHRRPLYPVIQIRHNNGGPFLFLYLYTNICIYGILSSFLCLLYSIVIKQSQFSISAPLCPSPTFISTFLLSLSPTFTFISSYFHFRFALLSLSLCPTFTFTLPGQSGPCCCLALSSPFLSP